MLGVMRALLMGSGANRTRLKDTAVKWLVHVAAERGVNKELLRVLVNTYMYECY